ncbi:MAG: helix-turn-helix domain-containing protein [Gomphosphaeria aponina SAG 52.96 = DSM 107014]|uniref:Helix-turn-helix domain-containing protein n=1 Tax=Gomphosphaeria aponina SAG 52.96 = DSM 107014 TaxID=1521640 RepID=A0A941JSH9_9CHRO|nr:helix-turn-helix domain-containing protein [Gomphosphaeria aponina SAG 52.96 = DSM 107014]
MAYNIANSCFGCGTCQPKCPTGAIHEENGEYWIESGLCNSCVGYYQEPQCVIECPNSSPVPKEAKKGRYKTVERRPTSPEIFANGVNTPFASSMAIWEGCNLLAGGEILPWETNKDGKIAYQREVKQGRGSMVLRLAEGLKKESIDIRAACVHLIYAAYATSLDKPWEEEFIISDRQIETYLGLDKRKDLSKAAKLTLIKTLAQQPCNITTAIDWPDQGKMKGFSVEESSLWHLREIKHHFQEDEQGCKHLIGLTFRVQAGIWAKYFLNKQGYQKRTFFYQYGTLPKFLLTAVMSIWQQHKGAARMLLWLLFKTKMGLKQSITVSTLMRVAYGEEKIAEAHNGREERKRLLRTYESDLQVLNNYGVKPIFDEATYQPEIQPLWVKLAEIPDDPEAALEFWTNDGNSDSCITDSTPRGKWNMLMKARLLHFELPKEWEEQLAKFEKRNSTKQKTARKTKSKTTSNISAEEIITARKHRGISQRLLAEITGKSQSWVRDLENGRLSVRPEDQGVIRKALGLAT